MPVSPSVPAGAAAATGATLHVFNASHDEALASGSPYYYPTRTARQFEADLAALPVWWAAPGDAVLVPPGTVCPAAAQRGVRLVTAAQLGAGAWDGVERLAPWGWDELLVHRLRRADAPERLLPAPDFLAAVRARSSRRLAGTLLPRLRAALPGTVGQSVWCASTDEVRRAVERYGRAMLKAPWSGSGRGVFPATPADGPAVWRRAARIVREQGGLEVEPYYERVADFALEFRATEADVLTFEGLSVFRTTPAGGYAGNAVADEATLRRAVPPGLLPDVDRTAALLARLLAPTLRPYRGPLGVDLMAVRRPDGALALHPCVEINLRQTMGRVALLLRREVPAGRTAVYALRRPAAPGPGECLLTPGAQAVEAVLTVLPDGAGEADGPAA